MSWQPISTAPKNALKPPKIDLWVARPDGTGYRVPDAFWAYLWKIETTVGFHIRAYNAAHTATHWMRRPAPPVPVA